MATFALRIWTGPTMAAVLSEKLTAANVHVACVGTEHVYVHGEGCDAAGAAWNVLVSLTMRHGTDFGLRPRAV